MSAQKKVKTSFLGIIDAARASEPEVQKASITESQNYSNTELQDTGKPEMANLTIKVSKARRKHWGVEAKKDNTNLTQVIIEALIAKYGDAD
ncbi:hypothetical protein [Phormidium tenue]|uniref:Uncharacterized protein n=1 Tax=Phormidium tenue FACHB-1050 TaxID=2692857 RepID=A0ABR8CI59_9CYAN|nr:hypothetical protein [Phormidium tenue]MBD2319456.1 hypothetical protein [Phormidium tenue FACHB-1050]